MEVQAEVKTFNIEYRCDKCKTGTLEYTNRCFYTDPLQYEHKCKNCGVKKLFKHKYPYQKLVTIEDYTELKGKLNETNN